MECPGHAGRAATPMQRSLCASLVALALVVGSGGTLRAETSSYSSCAASPVGATCTCKVLELRPTQLAVGMREVKQKEVKLTEKPKEKLLRYEQDHPEPVVRGPNGALFITDHHHLARALADLNISTTFCSVKADYSNLDASSFWAKMADQKWVYLYDENGSGPQDVSKLPATVMELKDDPYRSLAGAVEDAGGFTHVDTPFAQFRWANFFRSRVSEHKIASDFADAVKDATALAKMRDACSLPGYNGDSPC